MLKFNNFIRNTCSASIRFCSTTVKPSTNKEKWDILTAVSLERRPIIARDLTDIEKEFQNLLWEIEFERSHKSNFELRVEADKKRAKAVKEGEISIAEIDSFPQQTGQDFLDASIEELKSFQFASRKSDPVIEKDTKSLERALDRYLLLLVKEKIGQKHQWVLPQGKIFPGETLRESAERILQEKCGNTINAKFLGNAPFGFYKYRYPIAVRTSESIGAKIFFYKAQLLNGQVQLSKDKCNDFMWATRNELNVLHCDYLKSVKMFLVDEEH